jgi:uncharacterized membrane protein
MYPIVLKLHNLLAWLVLATAALVIVKALTAKATWGNAETSWVRRLTVLAHLQLVAGLTLWFVSPGVAAARGAMGDTMKDGALRRLVVEHPTLMILAVVAATVTSVMVRKANGSEAKATKAMVGTLITLVLVAAMIPWDRLVGSWTA